jgi:predicted glutamine amidotransferase
VAFAILGRIGLGFILPSLNLGAMRPLDKELIPQGASTINFLRMLGGAAGVSLCAIVLEWRIAVHGDSLANPAPARRGWPPSTSRSCCWRRCARCRSGGLATARRATGRRPLANNRPMCQLLGMNCNTPTDVTFSFTGFAQRGGRTDHHADGWGIAFFEGRGLRHFVDHQPACAVAGGRADPRYPIRSRNVVAHIRKATQGEVALENCHPFVRELWGRYWVFAHNGDLKDFHPRLHASFRPVGSTDSERAFCWIMQELAKSHAGVPSVAELTLTLRELAPQIAKHGPFNFLLSNGEALWAHCATNLFHVERRHPFAHAQLWPDEDLSVDFSRNTRPTTGWPWW